MNLTDETGAQNENQNPLSNDGRTKTDIIRGKKDGSRVTRMESSGGKERKGEEIKKNGLRNHDSKKEKM